MSGKEDDYWTEEFPTVGLYMQSEVGEFVVVPASRE